ncbi:MAG TPA: ATP-binding cassette domain-containing protein, partial [Solirubrobacteraceae bacterium]|nr:ATP-binding cassette domain-containing protein [Solirubrobacteraceae bacterium]
MSPPRVKSPPRASTDPPDDPSAVLKRIRIHTPEAPPLAGPGARDDSGGRAAARETVFDLHDVAISYGSNRALEDVRMKIYRNLITALIGPSGCGKTTFLRSLNRMNDAVPGFRLDGQILYHGHDLYGGGVNSVEVRRRIGMVFQ